MEGRSEEALVGFQGQDLVAQADPRSGQQPGDELVIEDEGDRIVVYDLETFILERAAEAAEGYRAGGMKTIEEVAVARCG